MRSKFLSKFPNSIVRGIYYRLDKHEKIEESEIEDIINKEIKDYIKLEEETYKESIIEDLTKNLKSEFVIEHLKDFFNTSYLIKIKKGMDVDEAVQKSDKDIESYDEVSKQEYTALNKIIRKITKDRPNDFEDVIKKLQDKLDDKIEISEEPEEKDKDIELQDLIDEEEKKPDRLTKYVSNTFKDLYNECFKSLKKPYEEHFNKYVNDNKDYINSKVKAYITSFKKENLEDIETRKRNNIVNLFDYVLDNYTDLIRWLDDGRCIYLINTIKHKSNSFEMTSGSICPGNITIDINKIKEIKMYGGTTITVVLEENL